ncbi:MAG: hypothetical protein IKX85_00610 [Clostridia bacterium]|nr:hypothetical protein [Clostridia bacterium]
MDLKLLHGKVAETLSQLDFEAVWPGFTPLRFALFDQEKCFFDGRYVEKTDAFCANTSILYEGEQIATWMAAEELEIPVLTSKIVHEMFHGFQTQKGWNCWPNELEALFAYEYDPGNLGLKLRENELMLSLLDRFDAALLSELLLLRKKRSLDYPRQFSYEIRTEEIEGTANYVEWRALSQLDEKKADELTERMRADMTAPERLFPIRISCYWSGALMINALLGAGLYRFEPDARPAILSVLKDVEPFADAFPGKEECVRRASDAVNAFREETGSMIRTALDRNEIVLTGPLELGFVNIYDARYSEGFLTTTYFLMYRENGEEKMLPGNYVIRMLDEKTIGTVYRWK